MLQKQGFFSTLFLYRTQVTYRVLLTRARQGVVIYLPNVDDNDWTRPSELYDSTYQFLKACHLKEI